jgi:hypothetical protein
MAVVPHKQKGITLKEKLLYRNYLNKTRIQMATELGMPVITLKGIMANKDNLFMS